MTVVVTQPQETLYIPEPSLGWATSLTAATLSYYTTMLLALTMWPKNLNLTLELANILHT